jgi:hypothetical protein
MHCKSVKISIGLPVVCWVFGDYNFTTGCPFIHSFFGEGIVSMKTIFLSTNGLKPRQHAAGIQAGSPQALAWEQMCCN